MTSAKTAEYIATFYTHHAALVSCRALLSQGHQARMMPVPRQLSSSCGTCVHYHAPGACLDRLHQDMEQVVRVTDAGYEMIHSNM